MFRPRVIPVLLLRDGGLVKTVRFAKPVYVGDPINAVRIYNALKADELIFLDTQASSQRRLISLEFVREVGEEANMPFAVGGGIGTLDDIRAILNAGAEKVVLNTAAANDPAFIAQAADAFGSSSITVCMDVKTSRLGGLQTWSVSGTKATRRHPREFAQIAANNGAGEIVVQSIERDGTMQGYDIELVRSIAEAVTIPVVALGGAGSLRDIRSAYVNGRATAVAAGSVFVFHDEKRGVLINYPARCELSFE